MKAHPAAKLFPLMGEDALADLAGDIAEHGQLEPIVTHGGQILDGRNRWLACERISREPRVAEYDGALSPVAYVLSANLHRRHLTTSQRAMVAAEAIPLFEAEALARKAAAGRSASPGRPAEKDVADLRHLSSRPVQSRSVDQAAKVVGVSGASVSHAKRLVREAPDLAAKVKAGVTTVDRATTDLRQRAAAAKGGDTTPPKPKRQRRVRPMSDAEFAEHANAAERQTQAAFAYDTLERLARCPYEPAQVAAAVPGEQRFRVDDHLKRACEWLEEFRRTWTRDDSGPAEHP